MVGDDFWTIPWRVTIQVWPMQNRPRSSGRRTTVDLKSETQGTFPDGKPALDEVLATSADVHLEQMDHNKWWMGIEGRRKTFSSVVHSGIRALVRSAY